MSGSAIAIGGIGMMTGVGLDAESSCAAIRCGIDNFQDTNFLAPDGEWLLGSQVPMERPWRGVKKLAKMLAGAIRECAGELSGVPLEDIPLIVGVAEDGRPGRLEGIGEQLPIALNRELESNLNRECQWVSQGRVGCAVAFNMARRMLYRTENPVDHVIVAGVDSYLVGSTLNSLIEQHRILTAENSDGFIPAEAAGALLLSRPSSSDRGNLYCLGLGFAREAATISSGEPLRADGLVKAIEAALSEAGITMADVDWRLSDDSGEQYGFREGSIALSRTMRVLKDEFDIWHVADCIGEVGAAVLPCLLGTAFMGMKKDYLPGRTMLCHLGNDDGKRAVLILKAAKGAS